MTVTLETLRADAEAASRERKRWLAMDWKHMKSDQFGWWSRRTDEVTTEAKTKSALLEIGEKQGLQAAMLFKLSGGNIDRREPTQAP